MPLGYGNGMKARVQHALAQRAGGLSRQSRSHRPPSLFARLVRIDEARGKPLVWKMRSVLDNVQLVCQNDMQYSNWPYLSVKNRQKLAPNRYKNRKNAEHWPKCDFSPKSVANKRRVIFIRDHFGRVLGPRFGCEI